MSQKPIVRLNPENHRCLKMAAVALGSPLNSLADEAVREWFKKNRKRIESATGGILTANQEVQPTGVTQ